jgi:hypothetical protein
MAATRCAVCGTDFRGRSDAVYCSSACRQREHRARTARRTAILRLRAGHVAAPVVTRSEEAYASMRRSVARSLERAREQVDRSRELCRTSTERVEQSVALQQRFTTDRAADALGSIRIESAP